MSWLEAKLALGPRPYPVAPLAERLGYSPTDAQLTSKLALRLDMNRGWVRRCRRLGLTTDQADQWAVRAGLNPGEVWPAWYSDLRGVALVNAGKLTCRDGHPLDLVDGAGFRRCGTCRRAQWRTYKSARRMLVAALVDAGQQQRAPLSVLGGGMAQIHGSRERLVTLLPPDLSQRIDELRTASGLSRSAWACMVLADAVRAIDAGELEAAS